MSQLSLLLWHKSRGDVDRLHITSHEDRAGNLWIGTSRGLGCFRNGIFTNFNGQENLSNRVVRAICEDHNGNLWLGMEDGLLCLKDGRFKDWTIESGLASTTAVLAFYEDAAGNLWIGTSRGTRRGDPSWSR